MPRRSSKGKSKDHDFVTIARSVVERSIGEKLTGEPLDKEPDKNPHAVALGRLGGQKGGKARAAKLSTRKKSQIAKRAAAARWHR
jgi:hypothetical protein